MPVNLGKLLSVLALLLASGLAVVSGSDRKINSQHSSFVSRSSGRKGYAMPWMCLEICNSKAEIQQQLDSLASPQYKDIFSGVSFELYTLGTGCEFVRWDNVTHVSDTIRSMGYDAWPMISSWPHPSQFINWMREVISGSGSGDGGGSACADKFIASAVEAAVEGHYVGYNLDWEPTGSDDPTVAPVTEADAQAYAAFIDKFSRELHKHGILLTVDIATWVTAPGLPSIWNYTAISHSAVDRAISMGTYTSSDSSFTSQLQLLTSSFPLSRLGVGLQTVNASDNSPLSDDALAFRFKAIAAAGAREVDLWDMPIPDNFLPFLHEFVWGDEKEKDAVV
jgi:hypothetical protein